MSKKVIYNGFNGERKAAVEYLQSEYGWEPVCFHDSTDSREWVERDFPNAIWQDLFEIRQGQFDYSKLGKPIPVDQELLEKLAKYESNYLSWLEDTTGWNFSFHERRRYYYDALKYWNTVISSVNPDVFLSYTTPHTASEYTLYLLCKHVYKIPVIYLNPIPFFNDDYFIFSLSNERPGEICEKVYLSDEKLDLSQPVTNYLDKLRSPQAQIPAYIQRKLSDMKSLNEESYKDYFRILKMVFNGLAFQKSHLSFKKNKDSWASDSSKLNNAEYILFRRKLARINKRLRKAYENIAEEPNLNQKYVYFPAPYQPELLSNLSAGVYEDVFLILDMLSDSIPEDWKIVYKEHPNTFMPEEKGALWRTEEYFQKVASYKNLTVVPFDMSTFELTNQAQAVCTVGGTAGWEAVVKGIPAFVFGGLWYQGCKSVFTIETRKDLDEAIEKVLRGYTPDQDDVDRYAEAVFRNAEHGLISNRYFKEKIAASDNPRKDMERVAEKFYQIYQSNFGGNIEGTAGHNAKEEVCKLS